MRSAFIGSDGALPEKASGLDVIIGTVGGKVLDVAYGLMRPGGRLVTLGAPPSEERAKSFGVHAMFFIVTPGPAELARLADLADNGKLRTAVSQTVPLRDGRPAFESRAQPRPQERRS
jgi:NADPH:quinone reductase-like Zn-dependent oxidoreductase